MERKSKRVYDGDIKQRKAGQLVQISELVTKLYHAPRLTYLFFELTDRCNLHCLHCGSNCSSEKKGYLEKEVIRDVLKTVKEDLGTEGILICITGGEPMLHPDFFEILSIIRKMGFRCGITTNGTLLTRGAAVKLVELGIGPISVSVDGLAGSHDWFRNVPGSYEKALQGIANLRDAGHPVRITTVIHKKNIQELDFLYEVLREQKVRAWRITNIEPIGRAREQKLFLDAEELEFLLEYIREMRKDPDVEMEVAYGCSHFLSYQFEREVRNHYFMCGAGAFIASIRWNGDIVACLDIEGFPELVQGNVKKDRFSQVWLKKFQEFRTDRSMQCDSCKICSEAKFCRGDSAHTWDFVNKRPLFCWKKYM